MLSTARRLVALGLAALALTGPAQAQQDPTLQEALASAREAFARAAPSLGQAIMGINTAAYGAALGQHPFPSASGTMTLGFVIQNQATGDCAHFAAYVAPVSDASTRYIFICPGFFAPGADLLRQTTILHELVHVIAGPDECRAMAYAARIQQQASSAYQPVTPYWDHNQCGASRYSLPR